MKRAPKAIKIGGEFVCAVIRELKGIPANIIREYPSGGNKFDLILTIPQREDIRGIIQGNSDLARELVREAESLIIIECSKGRRFKHIKANFGEILKLPALGDKVVHKVRGVIFVHGEIVNMKYKGYAERLNELIFKPKLRIALVELKEVQNKVMEFISLYSSSYELSRVL